MKKSICLWCGKPLNKHKDSICKDCMVKVKNGTYNMPTIFNSAERKRLKLEG